jgi:HlyD family secretion protein
MKKVLLIIGAIIIIGALIAFNLLRKEKGIEVTTEKVQRGVIQQKVTGSGRIQPALKVNISAQVAGKIVQLNAKEGIAVKKGQLLVALDPSQYAAAMERNESSLMAATANERKAESDFRRVKDLFDKGLVSVSDYENAQANVESARSTRMQADAALKEAQDALDKTRLYSTIDGFVTRVSKEVGEMAIGAAFQEDVIMVVSNLAIMEAVIEVDENEVIHINYGDSCDVELDAFPDSVFKGEVTQIANSAVTRGLGTQEQVTNFEVTVTLKNPHKRSRPGMSTTVDIYTKRLDDVVRVPIQAVTVREKGILLKQKDVEETEADVTIDPRDKEMQEVVFVVENSKAVAKPVKIGISDDTHYAILSGLEEDEEVITGPFRELNRTLKDGSLVSIKPLKKGK